MTVLAGSDIFRVLEITTSTSCHINCRYCPQETLKKLVDRNGMKEKMTLATFVKCLSTVPQNVHISFAGFTEPWLNPACTDMVEYAASQKFGLRVFTTLVGMSERHVSRLASIPYKIFVVHVFDDGENMESRFVNKHYLSVLRTLVEAKIQGIKFLVFGKPHHLVASIVPLENMVSTRPLISRAGSVDEKIVRTPRRVNGPISCAEGREYRNVLLPNGDVALCCMDYGGEHILGNLLVDPYESLHKGHVFTSIKKRMLGSGGSLICRSCEYAVPATGVWDGE